jgi:hypothetical protein
MYIMRHACRHRGQTRLSEAGFYYGFAAEKQNSESQITNRCAKSFTLMATFLAAEPALGLIDPR